MKHRFPVSYGWIIDQPVNPKLLCIYITSGYLSFSSHKGSCASTPCQVIDPKSANFVRCTVPQPAVRGKKLHTATAGLSSPHLNNDPCEVEHRGDDGIIPEQKVHTKMKLFEWCAKSLNLDDFIFLMHQNNTSNSSLWRNRNATSEEMKPQICCPNSVST